MENLISRICEMPLALTATFVFLFKKIDWERRKEEEKLVVIWLDDCECD